MGRLENKRVIITGAASGIGRASALLAAREGARVVVADVADNLEDTATAIHEAGGEAIACPTDVSDDRAVAALVAACVDAWGGVDGLYANAGIGGAGKPMTEITAEDFARTLSVNTVGVFLCVRNAVPHMIEQGAGSIVCTASVAALRANAGGVDYSASKAGVISIAQTVAYQLYGTGVRINAVCPGLIETGMTRPIFERARDRGNEEKIGQINPTARYGQPEEIAAMACFLMSDEASYVNGQAIPVDGGLSASHPWVYPQK